MPDTTTRHSILIELKPSGAPETARAVESVAVPVHQLGPTAGTTTQALAGLGRETVVVGGRVRDANGRFVSLAASTHQAAAAAVTLTSREAALATETAQVTATEAALQRQVAQLAEQVEKLGEKLGRAEKRIEALGSSSERQKGRLAGLAAEIEKVEKANEHLDRVAGGLQDIGGKMTMGITAPITGAALAATHFSNEFGTETTKLQTLVGLTADQVSGFRQEILKTAPALGAMPADMARGLFVVTSAGERGEEAWNTLTDAVKAGEIGLGEYNTVARVTTSAQEAWRNEGMKSREATELLLGTARAGKFDVTQLGQSIGQVIPVAAAMGVHFDEVGAFIAGFTRINGDAAQSVTYLRGFLSTLLAPTDEVKSVLKDLSKATGDTTLSVGGLQKELREKGLVETLQHLIHATGGNVTILGKIIPSVEGLTGVLGTAGLQGERFTGVLGEVRGALGTLDQTFATSHATDGAQFKEATANLQVLAITAGNVVAPALVELVHAGEPVIKWATGAAEWFGELPEPVKDTGLAVVGVVASFGPLLYVGGSVLQLYKSLQVAHVILTADLFKKAGAAGAAAAADGAEATAAGAAAEATDLEAAAAKDAAAAMSQLTLTADEAAGANAEAGVTAGEAATAIEGEAAAARDAATALATVATEADAAATGAEAAATALSSTATGADAAAAGTAAVGAAAASTAAVVGTTLVAALGAAALGYWMVKDRSHEAADEVEESARRAANAATLFNGSVATMSQSAAYAALGEKGHALAATEAQLAHLQQQQKEMAAGAPGFFGRSAAAAVAMWGANPEYVQRLWDRDDRARVIEEQVTRLTQARDALQSEVGALTERVHTTSAPPDPLANNPALQALIAQLNQPNGGRTRERKQTPDQRGLAVELAPTLQNVAALGDAFTDLDAQVLKAQTDLYASLGALQTLPVRSDAFKAKNEEVFNLSVKLRGLRAELEATRLAFNFRSAQMGGATLAADGTLVPNANARAISTTVSTAAQRTLTMEQLGGRWQSWGVTREMEQQNRRTELAGAARIGAGWGDLSDAQRAAAGSKREYQDMVASYHQGSLQLKQASVVAVDAFSQMAQAVISGSQTTSEAMVSMVTQIAQAAVPASAGPLVGPIIGAVGGILGALIAKRHKDAQEAQQKVQPVSVERYSPEALRQQSTKEGPDAVFLQMVDANTGRTISEQKYLLDRGERRDAVNRIPSASRSSF